MDEVAFGVKLHTRQITSRATRKFKIHTKFPTFPDKKKSKTNIFILLLQNRPRKQILLLHQHLFKSPCFTYPL